MVQKHMKTITIIIPPTLNPDAVSLPQVWKGNVHDSVAGLDEWLGEHVETVLITASRVLDLFRLAHARELIRITSVRFVKPDGSSEEVTVAQDGRLSRWPKSVLWTPKEMSLQSL